MLGSLRSLTQLDLRLNPVASGHSDYRTLLIHLLPKLSLLDAIEVSAVERALAARQHAGRDLMFKYCQAGVPSTQFLIEKRLKCP